MRDRFQPIEVPEEYNTDPAMALAYTRAEKDRAEGARKAYGDYLDQMERKARAGIAHQRLELEERKLKAAGATAKEKRKRRRRKDLITSIPAVWAPKARMRAINAVEDAGEADLPTGEEVAKEILETKTQLMEERDKLLAKADASELRDRASRLIRLGAQHGDRALVELGLTSMGKIDAITYDPDTLDQRVDSILNSAKKQDETAVEKATRKAIIGEYDSQISIAESAIRAYVSGALTKAAGGRKAAEAATKTWKNDPFVIALRAQIATLEGKKRDAIAKSGGPPKAPKKTKPAAPAPKKKKAKPRAKAKAKTKPGLVPIPADFPKPSAGPLTEVQVRKMMSQLLQRNLVARGELNNWLKGHGYKRAKK